MSKKTVIKPLAIALGATFVTSLAATSTATAAQNPFGMSELPAGYMVAEMAEGKCGAGKMEGKAEKMKEGKCGAGKMEDKADKMKEGKCGAGKMEGKSDKMMEKSGKMKEGKCGEGKCGAGMKK